MDYRIMFLRDSYHKVGSKVSAGQPVGCVAIRVHRYNNTVDYQVSVLNPTDRFDRKLARQLAIGRLVENPTSIGVGQSATMHDISEAVMQDLADDRYAPTRARKAARLWLKHNFV